MYRKVTFLNLPEKQIIQASGKQLSTYKISKTIEPDLSCTFDYPIKYLEVFQTNTILIITENFEFSLLTPSLKFLHQGKFLVQKPFPTITACSYSSKFPSILLNFRQNSLTNLTLSPRPIHYSVPINDEVHWPSSFSQILKIVQVRGDNPTDFANRKFFCFLVLFSDYASIHSASLDEYNKELVPGPWAIKFLPNTLDMLSVHNTIIAFSATKIVQFQISSNKLIEIPSEQITAVMEYSDKCNRILCAAHNKLIWLHVSPETIKTSPAANLPIDSCIDQLLNLNTQNSLSVLCYSIKAESIAIMINLKNLTVGEICRWQGENFWPQIFVQGGKELFMAGYKKIRVLRNLWTIGEIGIGNVTGDRVLRVSEDCFVLTGPGFSYMVKLNGLAFQLVETKELLSKQRSLLMFKAEKKLVQVTSNCINVLGSEQVFFSEPAVFALALSKFIVVAFVDSISIYKDLQIVRQVCMDNEILSIIERNKEIFVAVKDTGLVLISLEDLRMKKYSGQTRIFPQFYYWNSEFEVFSNSSRTLMLFREQSLELDFGVIRVKLLKESLNYLQFFVQGVEDNYIVTVPGFCFICVDFFDAVNLYESTFLATFPDCCKIGAIERSTKVKTVKIADEITSLAVNYTGIYAISNDNLCIYSHQLQEISRISLKNLPKGNFCTFFQTFLIISSENWVYFLSIPSFTIDHTIQTPESIHSISSHQDILLLNLHYSILIYKNFSLHAEVKFLSPEYEEIGKKLASDDLESIIQLKLSEKYQRILKLAYINTGRTHIEKQEMRHKECVCVTEKGIYWGKLEKTFEQLTQQKFDFDCIGCSVIKNKIYTLHYNHLYIFALEVVDSLMILMNAGHVDWRSYQIRQVKKIDTIEGVYLNISDEDEATIISVSGESRIYDLKNNIGSN